MLTFDVFRSTNSEPARTDHVGTVEADTPEQAIAEAQAQFECRKTHHLWVSEQDDEPTTADKRDSFGE